MEKITIEFAGIPIRIGFNFNTYCEVFRHFASDKPPLAEVSMSMSEIESAFDFYAEDSDVVPTEAYVEELELGTKVSDKLIEYDCIVFHAAAFVWSGRAWLLSAPSGTGKSTQYALWKTLYGEKVQMLNGDKPILKKNSNGFSVHPSPWAGKENMGQNITAPLGGIIFLEQCNENSICRLTPAQAVGRVLVQFVFSRDNECQVRAVCRLEEEMLNSIPVYLLKNRGDFDSARLCHDFLEREEIKNEV